MKTPTCAPLDLSSLPGDALLTDTELAATLRLNPGVLRNWRLQRRGPRVVALGRSRKYRVSDVLEFLAAQTRDFATDPKPNA